MATKQKKQTVLYLLVIASVLLFGGIIAVNWTAIKEFIKQKRGSLQSENKEENTTNNNSNSKNNVVVLDDKKVLKKGVSGQEVLFLQQSLNKLNLKHKLYTPQLIEDGVFGSKTENALLVFAKTKTITLKQAYQMLLNGFQ